MEVELNQLEWDAIHGQGASLRVIHLDGVPVIHYFAPPRTIGEREGCQIGFDEAGQVDRRLILAGASGVLRREIRPMVGPLRTRIAPVRFARSGGARSKQHHGDRDSHDQVACHSSLSRAPHGRRSCFAPRARGASTQYHFAISAYTSTSGLSRSSLRLAPTSSCWAPAGGDRRVETRTKPLCRSESPSRQP